VFTCILASSRITRSRSWKTDPSFLRGFCHTRARRYLIPRLGARCRLIPDLKVHHHLIPDLTDDPSSSSDSQLPRLCHRHPPLALNVAASPPDPSPKHAAAIIYLAIVIPPSVSPVRPRPIVNFSEWLGLDCEFLCVKFL
jgi:hypothetical protein